MPSPERTVGAEVQADPIISFEGDEVRALAAFLWECRREDRPTTDYFRVVDMHNKVLKALGLEPVPVHPSSQEEYEAYKSLPAIPLFTGESIPGSLVS